MKKYPSWFYMPVNGDAAKDSRYPSDHWSRPSIQRVLSEVNHLSQCTSIVDVGCGSLGFLSKILSNYVAKYAIDVYRPAVLNAGDGVQFVLGDLACDELAVPRCDVVVATEVMEHVRPDRRRLFAANLLRLSKVALFVTIPYDWKTCSEPVPHNGYDESNVMEWFWPIAPDVSEVIHGHLFMRFDRC